MTPTRYARRLAVEIAAIIAAKLVLLTALWWVCFSPEHRVRVAPERVDHKLLTPSETP